MTAKTRGFVLGVAVGMVVHYAYINAAKRGGVPVVGG